MERKRGWGGQEEERKKKRRETNSKFAQPDL